MIAALAAALLLTGVAEAGTPLRSLQAEAARASAAGAALATAREASRQAVVDRYRDIEAGEALLARAHSPQGLDNKKLSAAMDALAKAKAAYDGALARERAAIITSVQADAAARAARQALTDAANGWTAEGEALVQAARRADAGESVRRKPERSACLADECAPISAREQVAMIAIGAIAPGTTAADWPTDTAAEMTLLPPDLPTRAIVRRLRTDLQTATESAKIAQDALSARRPAFGPVLGPWETALTELFDAYFRPKITSHAEETLAMAVDGYEKATAAVKPVAAAYRAASIAADDALAKRAPAEAALSARVTFFADTGTAVTRAARMAARGAVLSAQGNAVAECIGTVCTPTGGLEAAAFVVIGAATPGAEKTLSAYLARTPDKRWVFRVPD